MLNLLWIFEHMTAEPFNVLSSVNFTHEKVHQRLSAICILIF